MLFSDLQLIEPLLRAVHEEGYEEPTPIQVQAVPHVLAGRDLLGIAQTGTGKTAAFALPLLQRLMTHPPAHGRRPVRVLVVTPTRELAAQVAEAFRTYGRHLPLRTAVAFGGVNMRPQVDALMHGVDVLVATPGRLLDLLRQGCARLDRVEACVLDEADRMLDMGFLPDVRRILAYLPAKRQTLFFSATMSGEPQVLADRILKDPARVEVTPQATTVERVNQSVVFVEKAQKQDLLARLLSDPSMSRTLVFTRTKHGANKVVARLEEAGIRAEAIHANKSQKQRERALASFKAGHTGVLVATDIAARGIDVDGISHVVNFDLPNVPESYVHRIGRTARAGAEGSAISFCDSTERAYLRDIEREIRMRVPVLEHAAVPGRRARAPHAPQAPHAARAPHAQDDARAPHAAPRRPAHADHFGEGLVDHGPRADAGPGHHGSEERAHPRGAHAPRPHGAFRQGSGGQGAGRQRSGGQGFGGPRSGGQGSGGQGRSVHRREPGSGPATQRPQGHWGGAPGQGPAVPYGQRRRRRSGSGPSRQR